MEIQLTQGKVATIDDEDWPLLAPFKWHAKRDVSTGRFYACTKEWQPQTGKHKRIIMHRLIMGANQGELIDHRDRDGLNNRRENLRFSDNFRNQQNRGPEKGTSKYKCVAWQSDKRKWRVRFKWLGKDHFVGLFDDERSSPRLQRRHPSARWRVRRPESSSLRRQFPNGFPDFWRQMGPCSDHLAE